MTQLLARFVERSNFSILVLRQHLSRYSPFPYHISSNLFSQLDNRQTRSTTSSFPPSCTSVATKESTLCFVPNRLPSHMSTISDSDDGSTTAPSQALITLLAPDGYYAYLKIPKTTTTTSDTMVDEDLVKKNYRKLSLKHHPDKPGGDAETFRVLNRAQKVLMNPKLKQQYDILGLDLDDEDDDEHHHGDDDDSSKPPPDDGDGRQETSTTQGIVHEIASMALTTVLQLGVRTSTLL